MEFNYSVGSACGKRIKIGWARSHEELLSRLRHHARHGHSGILYPKMLWYTQGTYTTEKRIQQLLSIDVVDAKVSSEIFHATNLTIGYAVWMRIQWHTRCDDKALEVPDLWEFEHWKPAEGRIELTPKESESLFESYEEGPWHWLPTEKRFPNQHYVAPENYIEAVRAAFGGQIDLDPCSDPFSQRFIQANRYYSESMNGLELPWPGTVWLNPPFAETEVWFTKAMNELDSGRTTELVGLVDFDKVNSGYFQKFLPSVTLMCLSAGRVRWTDRPQTKTEDPVPRHGYIFLYYGNNPERFRVAMRQYVAGTFWRADTQVLVNA